MAPVAEVETARSEILNSMNYIQSTPRLGSLSLVFNPLGGYLYIINSPAYTSKYIYMYTIDCNLHDKSDLIPAF